MPALVRQRQAGFCELEVSLFCTVSSKTAKDIERDPVSKRERKENMRILVRMGCKAQESTLRIAETAIYVNI